MRRRNKRTGPVMQADGTRPGATFKQSVRLWQARYQAERAAQAAPAGEDEPLAQEQRRREAVLAWLSAQDGR
jgi:hypothetical protein